ncbi:hypothetical protein WR25_21418 [Diploscapter pachys]|uniref:Uncharacterized protein n=1 Tax=Diploscapter pachys TaxID=2018661 RepID=A0A2A2K8A3_9BILA|nr:hypothetical protein WR25_21418 [Diploscapter pachys]
MFVVGLRVREPGADIDIAPCHRPAVCELVGCAWADQHLPDSRDLVGIAAVQLQRCVDLRRHRLRGGPAPIDTVKRASSGQIEEVDHAGAQRIICADDFQPALRLRLHQQRIAVLPHGAYDATHVLTDGILRLVARGSASLQYGRDYRLDHITDGAGEAGVLLDDVHRGLHRAARLVPHNDHQRHTQHRDCELDRALRDGIDGIAGVADDEQLAEPTAEQQLGRHAAVGARDIGAERRLPARQVQATLGAEIGCQVLATEEGGVAVAQQLKRRVRRQRRFAVAGGRGADDTAAVRLRQDGRHTGSSGRGQGARHQDAARKMSILHSLFLNSETARSGEGASRAVQDAQRHGQRRSGGGTMAGKPIFQRQSFLLHAGEPDLIREAALAFGVHIAADGPIGGEQEFAGVHAIVLSVAIGCGRMLRAIRSLGCRGPTSREPSQPVPLSKFLVDCAARPAEQDQRDAAHQAIGGREQTGVKQERGREQGRAEEHIEIAHGASRLSGRDRDGRQHQETDHMIGVGHLSAAADRQPREQQPGGDAGAGSQRPRQANPARHGTARNGGQWPVELVAALNGERRGVTCLRLVRVAGEQHAQPVPPGSGATPNELDRGDEFVDRERDLQQHGGRGDQRQRTPGAYDQRLDNHEADRGHAQRHDQQAEQDDEPRHSSPACLEADDTGQDLKNVGDRTQPAVGDRPGFRHGRGDDLLRPVPRIARIACEERLPDAVQLLELVPGQIARHVETDERQRDNRQALCPSGGVVAPADRHVRPRRRGDRRRPRLGREREREGDHQRADQRVVEVGRAARGPEDQRREQKVEADQSCRPSGPGRAPGHGGERQQRDQCARDHVAGGHAHVGHA